MKQKAHHTTDVIMAGVGGKGVLTIGQMLAEIGLDKYAHSSYFPYYLGFQRGFPCDCTVVLSDEKIASTVVYRADAVIVLEASQLPTFQNRAKPGGLLVVEKAGLAEPVGRSDIQVIQVPGIEVATRVGSVQAANFVIFGAYVASSKVLPPETVSKQIEARYTQSPKIGKANRTAFEEGVKFFLKMGA